MLQEEYKLVAFKNRMMRRIFGLKRKGISRVVTGE
jgi:hypothetical protein